MTQVQWVAAQGYFSESPHDLPTWVGVTNGQVVAIEHSCPDGVDAEQDGYLLPLLADTHAHIYMNPWPLDPAQRSAPGGGAFDDEVTDALSRLDDALCHGVGFVRDMGDPFGINLAAKERSPIVLQVPGPAIHRPKKYGRYLGVSRETIADVIDLIDKLAEDLRVDYIKLTATGIVSFKDKSVKQAPQFMTEELAAAVCRAHDHGLKTAAHCSGDNGLDIVLDAGVDFIEHGYFIRPDQLKRAAEHGRYWTPTFAPVLSQYVNREVCGWDDDAANCIDEILADHRCSFASAEEIGTPVLAGTDGGSPGVPIGKALRDELAQMEMAGALPERLLRLVSADAADACQPNGYSGRIRLGDPADFAIYGARPWEAISNLSTLSKVYREGEPC